MSITPLITPRRKNTRSRSIRPPYLSLKIGIDTWKDNLGLEGVIVRVILERW